LAGVRPAVPIIVFFIVPTTTNKINPLLSHPQPKDIIKLAFGWGQKATISPERKVDDKNEYF
jgi:hypothetical protein